MGTKLLAILASVTFVLLHSSSSTEITTIGLDAIELVNGRLIVYESVGTVRLCAVVTRNNNSINSNGINISVIYQDRSAVGGSDFQEIPYSFLFMPNATEYCFDVMIINDSIYEVRQEFFVNITTHNEDVYLDPHFVVIVVDDDDEVIYGWEHESYTVGEAEGQLEVCARFTGILEATLPQSNIIVEQGSAIHNEDFVFPCPAHPARPATLNFRRGSNSSSKVCFCISIPKDIKYEGEKNFLLKISENHAERCIIEPERTTVIIQDHNVITVQQPSSACEGLKNLINSSSETGICAMEDTTSSELCDAVTCSSSNWSLILSLQACVGKVILNVTDNMDNITASKVFPSDKYSQALNHTVGNQTGRTILTSRVVTSDQRFYYLISLDSPLLNISLLTTAIPVECFIPGTAPATIATTTMTTTNMKLSSTGRSNGGSQSPSEDKDTDCLDSQTTKNAGGEGDQRQSQCDDAGKIAAAVVISVAVVIPVVALIITVIMIIIIVVFWMIYFRRNSAKINLDQKITKIEQEKSEDYILKVKDKKGY